MSMKEAKLLHLVTEGDREENYAGRSRTDGRFMPAAAATDYSAGQDRGGCGSLPLRTRQETDNQIPEAVKLKTIEFAANAIKSSALPLPVKSFLKRIVSR
ncbi:MAG: hypothetical protein OEW15_12510 [Nitrospirota bacterium]|nr:hypothetical protein [Nitrospirota bacterium]